jgi:hypothetical protein
MDAGNFHGGVLFSFQETKNEIDVGFGEQVVVVDDVVQGCSGQVRECCSAAFNEIGKLIASIYDTNGFMFFMQHELLS